MKKVLIFGSTGSIGRNTLEVIRRGEGKFKVLGLCAHSDSEALYSQIKEFNPEYVCLREEKAAQNLKLKIDKRIKLFSGEKGLEEFSTLRSDISLMAISGISCLKPLLINLKYSQRVALANKESVVTAGALVFKQARKYGRQILPVDSEINAIFQIIHRFQDKFETSRNFSKVYLTASGGALADCRKKDLTKASVKRVLAHPVWNMGERITVDCATLVNKGFEVVETHSFFNIPYEKIDIVIHRESLIHALVELKDKTIFACLYPPDMKMPISHVLHYPQRFNSFAGLNLFKGFSFSFAPVDYKKFPLLKLILEAARRRDNSLTILNAADEVAVDYFLKKKIKFTGIHKALEHIFKHYPSSSLKEIKDVFYWDNWARIKAKECLDRLCIS